MEILQDAEQVWWAVRCMIRGGVRGEDGAEVFSLIRESDLEPSEHLNRFFDTGTERQDDL